MVAVVAKPVPPVVSSRMSLHDRYEIEMMCETNMEYRALCMARCEKDVCFWINAFCWTYDPRNEGFDRYLPFMLHPQQEDYARFLYDHIQAGQSCGVEKSRDMGATWISLAVILHGYIFQYGFAAIVGSITEDDIDKKDEPSCLMWKLDFMLKNLPKWMQPVGFTWNKHRTFMKLANPANGSIISGEVAGPNFGRSGRSTCAFMDELGHWELAEPAWNACSQTTKCRIACSTPNGMNMYGRLMNPEEGRRGIDKMTLHWLDDLRKNEWIAFDRKPMEGIRGNDPEFLKTARVMGRGQGRGADAPNGTAYLYYDWYEYQKFEVYNMDLAWLAQEVDIDYKRSVRGRVYTQFDYVKKGRFFYNPDYPLYTAWDFGADMTAILWVQWNWRRNRFQVIDYVEESGRLIDWFVPFITGKMPSGFTEEYTALHQEIIKRHADWDAKYDAHYGDPSGKQTNQVADVSVLDVLNSYNINVITNDFARRFGTRIQKAKSILMRTDVDEIYCAQWIKCMENYRFPNRGEGHQNTGSILKPIHNKWSHGATAWEYFAVNEDNTGQEALDPDGDGQAREESHGHARPVGISGY